MCAACRKGTLHEYRRNELWGSASAIAYHYDVGRAFYALWLDDTLSYSCALWPDASAGGELRDAQLAKIRLHLDAAHVQEGSNVLDIGCGWGALLQLACLERRAARATGLTLSHDQFDYVSALGLPHADVRLEHWADHEPEARYDSIVSVGAFEHFASPEDSDTQKIALYADFFVAAAIGSRPTGACRCKRLHTER